MELNLNLYETMALVCLVFFIGRYLPNKITTLSKYCIPPAVVGGFLFSLLILIFHMTGIITLNLDTTLQNIFMTAFFTSIGFTASINVLKKGGLKVVIFLGLSILLVTLQNVLGVTLASLFSLNPLLGQDQFLWSVVMEQQVLLDQCLKALESQGLLQFQ